MNVHLLFDVFILIVLSQFIFISNDILSCCATGNSFDDEQKLAMPIYTYFKTNLVVYCLCGQKVAAFYIFSFAIGKCGGPCTEKRKYCVVQEVVAQLRVPSV